MAIKFFIALVTASLLLFLYSKKIDNDIREERKIPPTNAQIELFLSGSGLKEISVGNFVYFDHGPDKNSLMYFFSQNKSDIYQVVLKLNPDETGKFVDNKVFSSKDTSETIPRYPEGFEHVKPPKGKLYVHLNGQAPTSKYTNLYATIDEHGDFSYVYIIFALPEN